MRKLRATASMLVADATLADFQSSQANRNKHFPNFFPVRMDEAFQRFYRTLDSKKFKYFVKGDECVVYNSDIAFLPKELQTKGRSVKVPNIESVVREMLTTRGISVEEYSDSTLLRAGRPLITAALLISVLTTVYHPVFADSAL